MPRPPAGRPPAARSPAGSPPAGERINGERIRIAHGGYEAEIASVGATLRALRADGRDLVQGFAADRPRPAMRGALLVPWPNRLADGSYAFGGETHTLPIDEPATMTATHGLVSWLDFAVRERDPDRVRLEATLEPRPGYPWRLHVAVTFALGGDGLSQEVEVVNDADTAAPVGIGGHPYLLAGPARDGGIDDWTLHLDAGRALIPSAERMLPEREADVVREPNLDFRAARRLSGAVLNHPYTDLARNAAGLASAELRGPGGGVRVEWDERCPWVQIYTSDHPVDGMTRTAVAVEPTTCPPDAFNAGRDLRILQPGERTTAGWRIRAL